MKTSGVLIHTKYGPSYVHQKGWAEVYRLMTHERMSALAEMVMEIHYKTAENLRSKGLDWPIEPEPIA